MARAGLLPQGWMGIDVPPMSAYDQAAHDHRESLAVSSLMDRMREEVRRHGAGVRRKEVFVLVVDDSEEIRVALHAVLSAEGFNVLLAQNAQEAMSVVAHADVVVTDLMMPDVSGLDLLRAIRMTGFTVPVIALTAGGVQNLAADAVAAGAQEVLDKTEVLKLPALVDVYSDRA